MKFYSKNNFKLWGYSKNLIVFINVICMAYSVKGMTMENLAKKSIHPREIIEVDMFSKKAKANPATDYPESIRFMEVVDNENTKLIPIAEIRVYTFNSKGELVPKEKAESMLIEYLDANKKVIHSTRMKN